jgi:hypothetical protein
MHLFRFQLVALVAIFTVFLLSSITLAQSDEAGTPTPQGGALISERPYQSTYPLKFNTDLSQTLSILESARQADMQNAYNWARLASEKKADRLTSQVKAEMKVIFDNPDLASRVTLLEIVTDFYENELAAENKYAPATLYVVTQAVIQRVLKGPDKDYTVVLDVPETSRLKKPLEASVFQCRFEDAQDGPLTLAAIGKYKAGEERDFLINIITNEPSAIIFGCWDLEVLKNR